MVKIEYLTDFVICYFDNLGIPITPLKLQKVLYYVQAWHLVFFEGNPLFKDEPEAWVNGPVYRRIYNKFKKQWFEDASLSICAKDQAEAKMHRILQSLELDNDQEEYLFAVLQKYGTLEAKRLVYLTHAEDPWNLAREGYGPFDRCEKRISHESMLKYYSERVNGKK